MTRKRSYMVLMVVVFVFSANATPVYHVPGLGRLAAIIGLNLPDHLAPNTNNDSTWSYRGKTLRVRTNVFGDVSHIGYKLFDTKWAATYDVRPLLDFIERYALEEDALPDSYKTEATSRRAVTYVQGNATLLKTLNPDISVTITEQERRAFQVEWQAGRQKVSLLIAADYQILIGANLPELEGMIERDLCRTYTEQPMSDTLPAAWQNYPVSTAGNQWAIVDGGTFFSNMIRSQLYVYRDANDTYRLLMKASHPRQSLNNLLLTGYADGDIPLQLTLDKYDNIKKKLTLDFRQFIRYCETEGCRLYLGIKEWKDTHASATLFAVNTRLAYCHTLSLVVPISILQGQGILTGTLYAFTPLQNITEKFFITNP